MDTDLNHVTITGIVERAPLTRFASETGSQQTSFTLRVEELGPTGTRFKLFVPCEAYGQAGEIAGELNAGDGVLVAGKLKWTSHTAKDGTKKTNLCVLARFLRRLVSTAVEVSA